MSEPTTEQQLEQTRTELARLRAGLAAGLTPEQADRLRGATPEELAADARALAVAFGAAPLATPTASGSDVRGIANGSLDAGVAAYRAKHGLDEDGRRPEGRSVANGSRNPFAERGYTTG